jgi:hypothetical protein
LLWFISNVVEEIGVTGSLVFFDSRYQVLLNFAWLSSLYMSVYWIIALWLSLASDLAYCLVCTSATQMEIKLVQMVCLAVTSTALIRFHLRYQSYNQITPRLDHDL